MGLFDRLTRKPASFQWRRSPRTLYVDYDFSLGSFQWMSGNEPVERPTDAKWYGPGEEVKVAGFSLPGGMIYVGQYLPSPTGWNEPSLIVPTRQVNRKNPDRTGQHMYSLPAYESMARTSRGAYLEWLAEGRRNPSTSAAYAVLFMAGLERRVLVDIAEDDTLTGELPVIRAEMVALLDTYGDRDYTLQNRATEFINLIDLMTDDLSKDDVGEPPPLASRTWSAPLGLRIGLGRFAARKHPIPAAWALAWGWYNPDIPRRAPMTRCTEAFSRLFAIRYRERFGDGLVVRPGKRGVAFYYRPANFTLSGGSMELDGIPDVFPYKGPGEKLALFFAGVSAELDPYSRWIGYDPERARMLPALARLPAVLLDDSYDEITQLRSWANDQLNGESRAVLEGAAFITRWQASKPDRLSKAEATFLAQLLGHLGFGIEPDVRLGGQPIAAQRPVVLFRLEEPAPHSVTPAYSAATVLAHLAAAVSGADGTRSSREGTRLNDQVIAVLHLSGAERARLDAHVALLRSADIKLTGLTKRLDALGDTGRAAVGEVLIGLATVGGMVSPAKVTMLIRIYRMLKLDPASVPSRLHAKMTESRPGPARDPVLVRPAGAGERGYRIPPREDQGNGSPAETDFALDHATIQQRLADSDAVSALLGSIFEEPEVDRDRLAAPSDRQRTTASADLEASVAPNDGAGDDVAVAGLDPVHSRLLRDLVVRDVWTRAEFDTLAASHHLMPDGALDTLNEAALDAAEEPLIEGDEALRINRDALRELVA